MSRCYSRRSTLECWIRCCKMFHQTNPFPSLNCTFEWPLTTRVGMQSCKLSHGQNCLVSCRTDKIARMRTVLRESAIFHQCFSSNLLVSVIGRYAICAGSRYAGYPANGGLRATGGRGFLCPLQGDAAYLIFQSIVELISRIFDVLFHVW